MEQTLIEPKKDLQFVLPEYQVKTCSNALEPINASHKRIFWRLNRTFMLKVFYTTIKPQIRF